MAEAGVSQGGQADAARGPGEGGVVVIGGGFAGVTLTRELEGKLPREVPVTLLSEENYLLFSPLLSEVVGGSILPAHCVAPIRQLLKRARFARGRATGIDRERREVLCEGVGGGRIPYRHVVLACGVRADLGMMPGMAENAFPLKTPGDALELRNRVLMRLEQAEADSDPERRRCLLSFVIVGGGSSGIEVAGAIDDLLNAALRFYPTVSREETQVVVVEAGARLAAEFAPALGDAVAEHMERRAVGVRLGAKVVEVDTHSVTLEGGEVLPAGTTVCTLGAVPQRLMRKLDLEGVGGFVEVNPELDIPGQEGVWAIGDCARVPNQATGAMAPPTAQYAVAEARHLADNLRRRFGGETPRAFSFKPRAYLATVGHRRAVAQVGAMQLSGVSAWMLWRAAYLSRIPTLLRRVQVFFEWTWQALFPQDVTQFHYRPYRLADGTRFIVPTGAGEGDREHTGQERPRKEGVAP